MSMDSMVQAAIAYLRTALSLDATNCDEAVTDDGQPPPFAGETFYAVHEGEWGNDSDLSLDERIGLKVTITLRAEVYPTDRLMLGRQQLRIKADAVRAAVHLNYVLMNAANTLIGSSRNGFVEPLVFRDGGRAVVRDGGWFWSDSQEPRDIPGLSRTLTFARALRVQTLESMA